MMWSNWISQHKGLERGPYSDMRGCKEKMSKFVKKSLTKGRGDGIISKLSARAAKSCRKQVNFEGNLNGLPTE